MNRKFFILIAVIIFFSAPVWAATRTVTNCSNEGTGSLRQAIIDAVSGDEIFFAITTTEAGYSTGEAGPGLVTNEAGSNKWFRIITNSALPTISNNNIIIRGSTQTWEADNPLGPSVEVRANGTFDVFEVTGNYATIEGLAINRRGSDGGDGIRLSGGANYGHIYGCYIGLTATGEALAPNKHQYGIYIIASGNNRIGGTTTGERNIISGNSWHGIYFVNSSTNEVFGNYIGFASDGETVKANELRGICMFGTSQNNLIGTSESGGRNLIVADSSAYGISFDGSNVQNNYIYNNIIGLTSSEALPSPQGKTGIYFINGANNNHIGGTGAKEGNVISGNLEHGIYFSDSSTNEVFGNYIGFKSDGKIVRVNELYGISLTGNSQNNLIGTSESGGGNLIVASNGAGDCGIYISGSDVQNNYIYNNIIGLTSSEALPSPQGNYGIYFTDSANNNHIGGTGAGERNIISGNSYGIYFNASSANEVFGNYIGFASNGVTVEANVVHGICLVGNSQNNLIGTSESGGGNLIVGNSGGSASGIYFNGSGVQNNYIYNNIIGLTSSEALPSPQGKTGIYFTNGTINNHIGGTGAKEGNVISGNSEHGISFESSSANEVFGNYIGFKSDGEIVRANRLYGIHITGTSQNNLIGTSESGGGNLIVASSEGSSYGVYFDGSNVQNNYIYNNIIGLTSSEVLPSPQGKTGIYFINGANNNHIGGTAAGEKNIISGNSEHGIVLYGSSTNEVFGNCIGFASNGERVRANRLYGIGLGSNSQHNLIGTAESGGRNLIVASSEGNTSGICFTGSDVQKNYIYNNIIGLTSSEVIPSPQGRYGIWFKDSAHNNHIGGTGEKEGNVISGNSSSGISFESSSTNEVFGNYIGTDSTGTADMGNSQYGIFLNGSSNKIGNGTDGGKNIIAHNGADGVFLTGANSDYNTISRNSIFQNDGLGIDLTGDGANENLIYPTINYAGYNSDTGNTTVRGTTEANASVEVFVVDPDPTGYGEGKTYKDVTTADGSGNWSIDISGLSSTASLTATATDTNGNTSEFSKNVTVESLTLTAPDGGESWRTYSVHSITWTSTGTIASVKLEYSKDDFGSDINTIEASTPNNGSYDWTVPNDPSTEVKVRISNTAESNCVDTSDDYFEIKYISSNVVTNCLDDGGAGSLRYALSSVEAGGEIIFDITTAEAGYSTGEAGPGLVTNEAGSDRWFRIILTAPLTPETNFIAIKGSTQTREASNSSGPEVEIRANGTFNIFDNVTRNNITIEGLVLNRRGGSDGGRAIDLRSGANYTHIYGCYIGLTASGEALAPNKHQHGIYASSSGNNRIGGTTAGERNIISGNSEIGIYFDSSSANKVFGNYIGFTSNGETVEANELCGIALGGTSQNNLIGTSESGERNLIIGSSDFLGIFFGGPDVQNNYIYNNIIGLTSSEAIPSPQGYCGIGFEEGPNNNYIGGTGTNEGNVISGNSGCGIIFYASSTNEVFGNYIGTDSTGILERGNASHGVYIYNQASFNKVGPDNVIAFNADGIRIDGSNTTQEVITQNSIYSNSGKGIALVNEANPSTSTPEVITANHNEFTNETLITGESAPALGTVEVFKAQGNQGKTYLGSTTAEASGNWSITVTGLVSGDAVVATGTTANPETSEFSSTAVVTSVTTTTTTTTTTSTTTTTIPIHHFDATAPASAIAETPFSMTIIAKDSSGITVESVTGATQLSVDDGNITPESIASSEFTAGIWAGNVTLSKPGARTITVTNASAVGTAEIVTYNATIEFTAAGVSITIPAGSASSEITITITEVTDPPGNPPPGFYIGGKIFDITATPTDYLLPVTVTIPIEGPLADPRVYYWDGTNWSRDGITIVSVTTTSLTFTTTHFTIFAPMAATSNNLVRFGPNPYNPNSGTTAKIWYWLDADAQTSIYIVNMTGTLVWKETYASGANGGRAEANSIDFDGKDRWGNILGDGVYIYKIVQGGKSIGGGKIAIIK